MVARALEKKEDQQGDSEHGGQGPLKVPDGCLTPRLGALASLYLTRAARILSVPGQGDLLALSALACLAWRTLAPGDSQTTPMIARYPQALIEGTLDNRLIASWCRVAQLAQGEWRMTLDHPPDLGSDGRSPHPRAILRARRCGRESRGAIGVSIRQIQRFISSDSPKDDLRANRPEMKDHISLRPKRP
jgi:hypothetical protein